MLCLLLEGDGYSATPIECGDCPFTTHFEGQMFSHVKVHMGKEDKVREVLKQLMVLNDVK